jgi:uncharacterized phage-associated protein
MAISALSAGRTLCELRDWSVSNLELQKILYLAHMYYLGQHDGSPLIREEFEAWDYGPVVPELYHHVKGFGGGPVRNVFHWIDPVAPNTSEYAALSAAAAVTKGMRAGQLVANTHRNNGAWASVYRPNIFGITIPNSAILNEYRSRTAPA